VIKGLRIPFSHLSLFFFSPPSPLRKLLRFRSRTGSSLSIGVLARDRSPSLCSSSATVFPLPPFPRNPFLPLDLCESFSCTQVAFSSSAFPRAFGLGMRSSPFPHAYGAFHGASHLFLLIGFLFQPLRLRDSQHLLRRTSFICPGFFFPDWNEAVCPLPFFPLGTS